MRLHRTDISVQPPTVLPIRWVRIPNRRTLESDRANPMCAQALRRGHVVVAASHVGGQGKRCSDKRGIAGSAVGDVALVNVSTTERHAQRNDVMDTLKALQSIGDLNQPGGISTSGLLTLRAAQTMTTDLHAQDSWSPSGLAGTGLGSAPRPCRRMASAVHQPAGPRSPARASSWRPSSAAVGAVTRVQARLTQLSLPRLVTDHGRAGKAVTCGYPPRAQYVSKRVSRRHVSAGQRQVVPPPPEP